MSRWRRSAGYGRSIPIGSSPKYSTKAYQNFHQEEDDEDYSEVSEAVIKYRKSTSPRVILDDDDDYALLAEEDLLNSYAMNSARPCSSRIMTEYQIRPKTFAQSEVNKEKNETPSIANIAHRNSKKSTSGRGVADWEDDLQLNACKTHRRLSEIMNRCDYLVSKDGLDLYSLRTVIKQEEDDERAAEKQLRDEFFEMAKAHAEKRYFGGGDDGQKNGSGFGQTEILQLPPIGSNGVVVAELFKEPMLQDDQSPEEISSPESQEELHSLPRSAIGTFSALLATHHTNNYNFHKNSSVSSYDKKHSH